MSNIKEAVKLIDKSLVLGTIIEETDDTITVDQPLGVTQMFNPQTGEPEIALLPMDLIFANASDTKNNVSLKKEHIMWRKPLADFPDYEKSYVQQTTGIEAVTSGVIKG